MAFGIRPARLTFMHIRFQVLAARLIVNFQSIAFQKERTRTEGVSLSVSVSVRGIVCVCLVVRAA